MPRKGTLLIVTMSLSLVLIVTLTFMLINAKGTNLLQQQKTKIPSVVPENIKLDDSTKQENDSSDPIQQNNDTNEVPKEQTVAKHKETKQKTAKKQQIAKEKEEQEKEEQKEDKYLNRQTKNTNILCLGIADQQLEMISIYSINKENKKSAGIFLPTRTTLKVNGELLSLQKIYKQYGIVDLKKILSQCLEVDIPYHMVADKQGLIELSELIGPLYVENENIDIPNLFVRPVSDKDDEILQALADRITQPKMLLQVPKLIKIFIANVESDIGVSGLWQLYKVFSNLNHSELSKIVLWGNKVEMAGKEYWFIDPYDWHNIVYEMTH
jgi:hypothetical protein